MNQPTFSSTSRTTPKTAGRALGLLALALSLLVSGSGLAAGASTLVADQPMSAAAVAHEIARSVPAVQVAVWQEGALLDHAEVGWTGDVVSSRVVQTTQFPVFSMAKAWTVTALAALAERGKLNPTDPLATLVPAFADKRWSPTLMEVATHRGGIRHYRNAEEAEELGHCKAVAQALSFVINDPLMFEPGTRQEYSSWGFVLLSAALESASGVSFAETMERFVLRPASMSGTASAAVETLAAKADLVTSMQAAADGFEPIEIDPSCKWGAGGYYSTASDLVRFYGALHAGKLVSESMSNLIVRSASDGSFSYGGSGKGGRAQLVGDWTNGTFVAITSNARVEGLDLKDFANRLLENAR